MPIPSDVEVQEVETIPATPEVETTATESTDAAPAATVEGDKGESATPAEQGTEAGEKKPVSLRDVVRDAARPAEAKTDAAPPAAETGKPGTETPATAVESTKNADADDAKLPFHKHPRWKQVIGQKRELEARVATMAPLVEDYAKITDFVRRTGISNEDVGRSLQIVALLRSDPTEAAKLMQPWLERVAEANGTKLPPDLQKRVDDAAIDTDAAREIAQARQTANRAQESAAQTSQQVAHERAVAAQVAIQRTVKTWEDGAASKDPDYSTKQSFVHDRMRALLANKPSTPEAALEICQQAYKDVTDRLRPMAQAKQAMRTVTSTVSTGRTPAPQPKSMRDIVKQTLRSTA